MPCTHYTTKNLQCLLLFTLRHKCMPRSRVCDVFNRNSQQCKLENHINCLSVAHAFIVAKLLAVDSVHVKKIGLYCENDTGVILLIYHPCLLYYINDFFHVVKTV